MERVQDIRVRRTKEAIFKAFREMVCEKKPESINVKNLAERAGIHRKTFYLHYTCIEALYEDALNILAMEYFKEVEKLPIPFTYFELTRILFEFCSSSEYSECLYCNPNYSVFSTKLMSATLKHNRLIDNPYRQYSPEMQNIINTFVTNASMVSYRQWVSDGKKVPMDEAIWMVSTLLENGVSAISDRPIPSKKQNFDNV